MTSSNRNGSDGKIGRIMESALKEFSRRGFDGARESVIAREAGVSIATLKRFFPEKTELFREVVRSSIVETLQDLEPEAANGTPAGAVGRIREFAHWFWRTMDQSTQAALLRLSVGELHRFPELAVFHTVEVLGRAAHKLEKILVDSVRTGEWQFSDPRATSRAMLATLLTYAHWFAHPEIYSGLTGLDRERAEAGVIAVLLEGVRKVDSGNGGADRVLNSLGGERAPAIPRSSPDASP